MHRLAAKPLPTHFDPHLPQPQSTELFFLHRLECLNCAHAAYGAEALDGRSLSPVDAALLDVILDLLPGFLEQPVALGP